MVRRPLPLKLRCRQCASEALDALGAIPPATVFAGQLLEPPWEGGSLYLCRHCHLAFRHPVRPADEFERLYAQASDEVWVTDATRVDQRLVLDQIHSSRTEGKVLDVGCYDGSLLASLRPQFRKYGIEASAAAARKAQGRGVEIVGTRIADIPSINQKFDVVCAVDVIEHVTHPQDFLAMLSRLLLPNGTLLISTGSTDTPAWRAAGGLYWYCAFPEHISFISAAWAAAAAAALGLEVVHTQRFSYGGLDPHAVARWRHRYNRKLQQTRLLALVRRWLPGWLAGNRPARSLGRPGIFEDHILIAFKPISARAPSRPPV